MLEIGTNTASALGIGLFGLGLALYTFRLIVRRKTLNDKMNMSAQEQIRKRLENLTNANRTMKFDN